VAGIAGLEIVTLVAGSTADPAPEIVSVTGFTPGEVPLIIPKDETVEIF